jgi:lipopolysaccharide transport system permease protein
VTVTTSTRAVTLVKGANPAVPWIENRSRGRWPALNLAELWAYRDLAWFLALRDVKLRYKQTVFGVAWALLQPVTAGAVFSLVFGRLVRIPSDGVPYGLFVYSGLCLWMYFSSAVSAAATGLVDHRALISKVYFPRVLAPVAALLAGLLDLAISFVVLAVLLTIYHVVPTAALWTTPLWFVILMAAALGAGLWLSALNVLYRDVRYALGFLLQIWFFSSPVIFPSSLFRGAWRYVYAINPMSSVIDGFRWAVAGGPKPGAEVFVSVAATVVLLITGLMYFQSVERRMADAI